MSNEKTKTKQNKKGLKVVREDYPSSFNLHQHIHHSLHMKNFNSNFHIRLNQTYNNGNKQTKNNNTKLD